MKKALIAIDNQYYYNKFCEIFDIKFKDIVYVDDILEILALEKKIEIIVISQKIKGNIKIEKILEELLKKYKNIKIILIVYSKKIYKEYSVKFGKKIIIYKKLDKAIILDIVKINQEIFEISLIKSINQKKEDFERRVSLLNSNNIIKISLEAKIDQLKILQKLLKNFKLNNIKEITLIFVHTEEKNIVSYQIIKRLYSNMKIERCGKNRIIK